ncbi:MAG TPA: alpha/beta fold hydrolase [Gammaproteobacteria bacterium]
MLLRIATYLGVGYAALASMIFLLQRRLLYVPDIHIPSARMLQQENMKFWPQADNYRALVGLPAVDYPKGTIIIFHGNASLAAARGFYVRALTPLGYRVVLVEYPGYGGRKGELSETAFVADAKQTVKLVYEKFGGPIFIWGESLGSGVASAVASDTTVPVAGVILITPFDSVSALAQTLYWYVPARWLVWDKFDNVTNMQAYAGPVAVVLAGRDSTVPKRHTMRLYESIVGPKKLWVFENAGHTDWPIGPNESWWREVMDFVASDNRPLAEPASQQSSLRKVKSRGAR